MNELLVYSTHINLVLLKYKDKFIELSSNLMV